MIRCSSEGADNSNSHSGSDFVLTLALLVEVMRGDYHSGLMIATLVAEMFIGV